MLQVKNLSYSVGSAKNRTNILHDLNLNVKPGEFIVITGPNGSGKSTLAKLIMGLAKPTAGQIIWKNQEITNTKITDRARLGIAFAFQQPPHFKGLTVKDLLQISATGHETFLEDEDTDYIKLIESVGLDESYLDREVNNTLSGGELKRIEIASALALKEYAVKKNREQAAKFSKEELLDYYNAVYGAISALKCGELTPPAALKWVTAKLFFKEN